LDALRLGKLEYTKAVAVARVKDDRRRQDLLEKSVDQQLSVRQIRELVSGSTPDSGQSEKFGKGYQARVKSVSQRLARSKIWEDPEKLKELEKYLDLIENLLINQGK
jgi:ParB family transcriptional regulator, chromosome partitioning protein